jgi:hypothetical protein
MKYYLFTFKYESLGKHEDFFMAFGYTRAESEDAAKENLKETAIGQERSIREFESTSEYLSLDDPTLPIHHRKHFEEAEGAPFHSVIVPFQVSQIADPRFGFAYGLNVALLKTTRLSALNRFLSWPPRRRDTSGDTP